MMGWIPRMGTKKTGLAGHLIFLIRKGRLCIMDEWMTDTPCHSSLVDFFFCLLFLSLRYYLFYSDFIYRLCYGVLGSFSGAQHRSGWIWDSGLVTLYHRPRGAGRAEKQSKRKEQQFEILRRLRM